MGETGGLVGLPPDETRKNPPGIIGGQRPKAISSHNFCCEQESGQKSPDFRRGYDWHNEQWTVPINAQVSQLVRVGKQPVSIGMGGRYYAATPLDGPDWGVRLIVTLLYPKK